MTVTVKNLLQTIYVSASDTQYYVVPNGKTAIVKEMVLCNTTTSPVTVTVRTMTSGFTSAPENSLFQDLVLDAKQSYIFPMTLVMSSLDEMWLKASTGSAVVVRLSGVEF